MRLVTCSSLTSIASSRRLSKLPGARLMEPTMARFPSARISLAWSLTCWSFSFDTFILKNTEAADSLAQLLLLQFVGWPSHHMDVDPSVGCPHEMFDNDGVLVTLVLEPQRMFGVIDKLP